MKEHSKENILLGKVVFLVCIALAMLAVTFCSGQVTRMQKYPENPEIITIFPKDKVTFKYGKEEVTFGAFLDSLPNGRMFAYVYAYFPKGFKGYDNKLIFGISHGSTLTLDVNYIDDSNPKEVYVEYLIPNNLFSYFLHEKYNYIYVNNVKQFISVNPEGYYFTNFFMSRAFGK